MSIGLFFDLYSHVKRWMGSRLSSFTITIDGIFEHLYHPKRFTNQNTDLYTKIRVFSLTKLNPKDFIETEDKNVINAKRSPLMNIYCINDITRL